MPPFRNFLARKPQPNAGDPVFDENYLSPNQRPAPIPIRNSQDEPTEYKLSGRRESSQLAFHLKHRTKIRLIYTVVNDSGVYLPV